MLLLVWLVAKAEMEETISQVLWRNCRQEKKIFWDFLTFKDVMTFGIQAFGGVYEDFKQFGPASLEIEYIKLIY